MTKVERFRAELDKAIAARDRFVDFHETQVNLGRDHLHSNTYEELESNIWIARAKLQKVINAEKIKEARKECLSILQDILGGDNPSYNDRPELATTHMKHALDELITLCKKETD